MKYHPCVVVSCPILFVTPNFARVPRGLSVPGYCIPRGITMQKVSIFPILTPKNSQSGAWMAKRATYSNFCIVKMTNIIATKFCKFSLWVVPKSKMVDGSHIEKWINCYISATVRPIWMKFCMLMHISPPDPMECSKINLTTIQDGEWLPCWKTLNAISLHPFDRFWWNLVCWCNLALPTWWETKNLKKFQNPGWRIAAILNIEKSWYLTNCLANFDKILHDGTH